MDIVPLGDAATMADDGGFRPSDASDAAPLSDAEAHDAQAALDSASTVDAEPSEAGSIDAATPTPDAGQEPNEAGVDAAAEDTGMVSIDTSVPEDTGSNTPDTSTPADTAVPDATPPPPVNCAPIARTGVQLCDMGTDFCGAVFSNSSGCTATCAAAGLACATAYENVENQCARDETRPTLPCDSGHQSDYCLCKRP